MSIKSNYRCFLLFLLIPLAHCTSWGAFWENHDVSGTPPQTVIVWGGNAQVTVYWTAVSEATSYNIYYLPGTGGVTKNNGIKITGATSPYVHTGLTNGSPYDYVVTAVSAKGESAASFPDKYASPYVPCTTCKMFVTNNGSTANTYTPGTSFSSVNAADALCASNAAFLSYAGTYKAVIVDGIQRRACTSINCANSGLAEQIDWVLHPSTSYVQANGGAAIATTSSTGVFATNLTGLISAITSGYWTGISESGSWSWQTSANTCSGWTTNSAASSASYGVSTWTDARAIAISSAIAACNTANSLLCTEQ